MRRALVIAINNELAELAGDTLGAAGFEATDLNPAGGYLLSTPRGGGLYSSPTSLALINGDSGYNALEIVTATGQLTYNTNPVWHDGLYNVSTFIRTTGNQIITGFLDIVGDLVGTRVQSYDGTFFGSTNNVNVGPSPFSGANGTITLRPDGVGSTTGQLVVTNTTITHGGAALLKATDLTNYARVTTANTWQIKQTFTLGLAVANNQNIELGTGGAGAFGASNGSVAFAAGGGAGANLYLRPNGVSSTTGQVGIDTSGKVTLTNEQFIALGSSATVRGTSTGSVVIGANAAAAGGLLIMRPNGDTSTVGQVTLNSTGVLSGVTAKFSGNVGTGANFVGTATLVNISPSVNTGANGHITLRPNGVTSTAGMIDVGVSEVILGSTIRPATDNAIDAGTASFRFRTYYGVNSAINTSDARYKTEPRQLREAEILAFAQIARLPAVWRWLNRVNGDGCEPEGREARKHGGPTVQAAMAIMEAHGLEPMEYACFCYDRWEAQPEQWVEWEAKPEEVQVNPAVYDEEGNQTSPETTIVVSAAVEAGRRLVREAIEAGDRYSFRKEELLCLIVSAMASQIDSTNLRLTEALDMVASLLQRVSALESKTA